MLKLIPNFPFNQCDQIRSANNSYLQCDGKRLKFIKFFQKIKNSNLELILTFNLREWVYSNSNQH